MARISQTPVLDRLNAEWGGTPKTRTQMLVDLRADLALAGRAYNGWVEASLRSDSIGEALTTAGTAKAHYDGLKADIQALLVEGKSVKRARRAARERTAARSN